jgi:hypothetical protein
MRRKVTKPPAMRPIGPQDCFRTRQAGACSTCGAAVDRLHSPTRKFTELFGGRCCPCCALIASAAFYSAGSVRIVDRCGGLPE